MTQSLTILVVEDDRYVRESLVDLVTDAGYSTLEAGDGRTALRTVEAQAQDDAPVSLVLLDLGLPRLSGMEVLRELHLSHPAVPVVIISGEGTVARAVEATRLGVYDFLEKPVDSERTLLTIRSALERAGLRREHDRLLREAFARYGMIGSGPAMQRLYRLIDRAAATTSKVLLLGESGTGKEMVARAIHQTSERSTGPFVAVNCAAIPDELIESELFGHEKGAFTGAQSRRQGKFEQARSGTLFLDEIGDLSLRAQAKVLRALQEGVVERVGGTEPVAVDVRVVAATHRDLEAAVKDGDFREDLFFRLNILRLDLPPLRERREDVAPLIKHFAAQVAVEHDLPNPPWHPAAVAAMVGHEWPGNVRELRNVVERVVVMNEAEEVGPAEVRGALQGYRFDENEAPEDVSLRGARARFEKAHIEAQLLAHEGRILETADALGISRTYLWKLMQRYDIAQPRDSRS